jgi:arylsulfatase A-like enzyme
MYLPHAGSPEDERERRQMRATYHGAQKEVDDQLARLFDRLDSSGLADSTLVVLTSDHGEMGGDHWLFEKLGYWDESFHVPLIIRDPDSGAGATRGRVVESFTESVDVLPTICRWLGIEVPLQADGFALQPFITGEGLTGDGPTDGRTPDHWRTEAHWSWNFSDPASRLAERHLGLPMAHCSLDVVRGAEVKYVQFAAESDVLPSLLFDLATDPGQLHDLVRVGGSSEVAWQAAQRLVQWRMRNDDRTLAGSVVTASEGVVAHRDVWR